MTIRNKFMLGVLVFSTIMTVIVILTSSYLVRTLVFQEYSEKADIMLASMRAVRRHTGKVIRPEATKLIGPKGFVSELQSTTYTSNGVFSQIPDEAKYGIQYKTASTKPRNSQNMATVSEADIINELDLMSEQGKPLKWQGIKNIDGIDYYMKAAGEVNKKSCMLCHGVPEDAPQDMKDRYPVENDNGYNRLPGRVECAEIVSIPVSGLYAYAKDISFWIAGFCLLGLILAMAVIYYSLGSVFKPVMAITKAARNMADGDIKTANENLSNFKEKDGHFVGMTKLISTKDEVGMLILAIRTMTNNLKELVGRVKDSSFQISTSATQIAASATEIEASVSQQAASTNEVNATSRQISSSSMELTETMDEVEKTAENTSDLAENVRKGVGQREQTLRNLVKTTSTISSKLQIINEKAHNINTILSTITKIADQTNLLSLNAAIEAEKAGDFGHGFSVVAREIRRLADQTAIAAEDIELMVKDMHHAVSAGVLEMDNYQTEVKSSVEEVVQISRHLEVIMDEVGTLQPKFHDFSDTMRGHSLSASQINEAMETLSDTATQTSHTIKEFNKATKQLNTIVLELTEEVDKFNVD